MDQQFFIKCDGINGESKNEDHKDEIDVLSWSWGVDLAAGSGGGGGGSGAGRAAARDFHFLHRYDKASPLLAKSCASGMHVKDIRMSARKAGQGQRDFLVVTMKELLITSVQPAGSTDGGIVEQVSCRAKDIEFSYKAQDDRGTFGAEVKFGWNQVTNVVR